MMTALRFFVAGRSITQGSMKSFGTGRPMVASNAETLKPWRQAVKEAALLAIEAGRVPRFMGPVSVAVTFTFDRPRSHYGTGKNAGFIKAGAPPFPVTRRSGDVDKLVRAIFDSLTDAGVWLDDSQAARLLCEKLWVLPGGRPGASVAVSHR